MATMTTNYGLKKFELTDIADITAMNENFDKIDEQLKKAGETGGSDLSGTEYGSEINGATPTLDPVVKVEIDKVIELIEDHKDDNENPHNVPVDNNLLVNSNLVNPVNQRGKTKYDVLDGEMYAIDRWYASGCDVSVDSNGLSLTQNNSNNVEGNFSQTLELSSGEYLGKTLAVSFETDKEVHSYVVTLPNSVTTIYRSDKYTFETDNFSRIAINTDGTITLSFGVKTGLKLKWVKVEFGKVVTPYVQRTYSNEFLQCQRFFQKRYVKDARLVRIGSDYLRFAFSIPHRIRVTPVVDLSNVVVLKNNSTTDLKFTLSTQNVEDGIVEVVAVNYVNQNRADHGWTINDLPALDGYVYLDAEPNSTVYLDA